MPDKHDDAKYQLSTRFNLLGSDSIYRKIKSVIFHIIT